MSEEDIRLEEFSKVSLSKRGSKFELSLLSLSSQFTGSPEKSLEQDTTFEQIWNTPRLRKALKIFAAQTLAEENVMFIEDVLDMKINQNPSRAKRIYVEYIAPDSPFEINIPSAVKKSIQKSIDASDLTVHVFDEAVDELASIIRSNIITKFIQSYNGRKLSIGNLKDGRKRVVIVGGGFLGSATAQILDKMDRFQVILIDNKEYFEYTPGLIHAMVNPDYSNKCRTNYSEVVKKGQLIIGNVEEINRHNVIIEDIRVPYDYLVVSTGSSYTSHFKGHNVTTSYRSKKLQAEFLGLQRAQNILVIGGGLVGCEIASEVAIMFPEKKVTMIEANNSLLMRCPKKSQEIAMNECKRLGIEVILNERVVALSNENGLFETDKGRKLQCDKVYLATGPVPNTQFLKESLPQVLDEGGHVKTALTLQVEGLENVFSGGDVCNLDVEKLAYNSMIHGVTIARNVCRMEKGKPPLQMGQKGVPKLQKVQYAQVISFGPEQALMIVKNKFNFFGKRYMDFKYDYQEKVLRVYSGKDSIPSNFGRVPSNLR